MKKLISITIMIALSVFAVFSVTIKETHDIRLKSNVSSTAPAFQFEFTSGMSAGSSSVKTNVGAEVFGSNDAYNEYATQATAVNVADISQHSLNLLFTAKLANSAKCNGNYTLTFIANGFDVTRSGVSGKHAPKTKTVAAAEDLGARAGVEAGTLVPGESLKIHFNGTQCIPGDLATYSLYFQADYSIDPSTYYSNITLEISSDN